MYKKLIILFIFTLFGFSLIQSEPTNAAFLEESTVYQKIFYTGVVTCYELDPDPTIKQGGLIKEIKLSDYDGTADKLSHWEQDGPVKIVTGDYKDNLTFAGTMNCAKLLSDKVQNPLPDMPSSNVETRKEILTEGALYEMAQSSDSESIQDNSQCAQFSYSGITASNGKAEEPVDYKLPIICIDPNANENIKIFEDSASYQTQWSNGTDQIIKPIIFKVDGSKIQIQKCTSFSLGLSCLEYSTPTDIEINFDDISGSFADIGNGIVASIRTKGEEGNPNMEYLMNNALQGRPNEYTKYTVNYFSTCGGYEYDEEKKSLRCTNLPDDTAKNYDVQINSSSFFDTIYEKPKIESPEKKKELVLHYSDNEYDYDSLEFNDEEIFVLYFYYLKNIYHADFAKPMCSKNPIADPSGSSNRYQARLWDNDSNSFNENCYFSISNDYKNQTVNGVYPPGDEKAGYFGKTLTLDEMIEQMNALTNEEKPNYADYFSKDEDEEDNSCDGSGAANSIGWIPCQILEWASNAAESIYDDYVKPSLEVESDLFKTTTNPNDEQSATRNAWDAFRNIANIFCIIILLVVIISQVTGVGINNYGIKKILPKLIASIVLINLSFFLCQLAVDLSNITGNGIQGFFNSMSSNLATPRAIEVKNDETGETVVANISGMSDEELIVSNNSTEKTTQTGNYNGVITAVLILIGLFGVIGVIANPAILLTLLIGALGVLASILFLFVLLAGRKAVIVILTLLSPLAILCYMLPNTKKLYEKWISIWATMLLLYPVCGLLIGGGNYTSKLLLAVGIADYGGFFGAFTAMIVGVIPIFFIPTMIRKSFSALGQIGASLNSRSELIRGQTTRRLQNSNFNTRLQARGAERAKRLNLARQAGGFMDKKGKWHSNDFGIRRRLANTAPGRWLGLNYTVGKATSQYVNEKNARQEYSEYSGQKAVDDALRQEQSRQEAKTMKKYQEQFEGYDRSQLLAEANRVAGWYGTDKNSSQRLSALISTMEANGMEGDIFKMLRNVDTHADTSVMSTLAKSKNKVLSAYGIDGGNDSYHTYMSGGRLQQYIQNNTADFTNGIDDKALAEINSYDNGTNGNIKNIDTDTWIDIATNAKRREVIDQANKALGRRNDVRMSGEQLSKADHTTLETLKETESGEMAINTASDHIANNSKLRSKVKGKSLSVINRVRANNGKTEIT